MMFARSHLRVLPFWLILAAAPMVACSKKDKTDTAAVAKKNAELQRSADSAKQALKKIEAPLAELNGKFDTLHKEYSVLPADLPNFEDMRARFFTAYITLGTLSTKPQWLLGRIETALKSGDAEELEAINRDAAAIPAEIAVLDKIALESLHKVIGFKKAAESYVPVLPGQTSCENVNAEHAKKAGVKKASSVAPARQAKSKTE